LIKLCCIVTFKKAIPPKMSRIETSTALCGGEPTDMGPQFPLAGLPLRRSSEVHERIDFVHVMYFILYIPIRSWMGFLCTFSFGFHSLICEYVFPHKRHTSCNPSTSADIPCNSNLLSFMNMSRLSFITTLQQLLQLPQP
jgi:hypothetical protein